MRAGSANSKVDATSDGDARGQGVGGRGKVDCSAAGEAGGHGGRGGGGNGMLKVCVTVTGR